jgi:hypothetical protein
MAAAARMRPAVQGTKGWGCMGWKHRKGVAVSLKPLRSDDASNARDWESMCAKSNINRPFDIGNQT